MSKDYDIVDSIESLEKAMQRIRKAQQEYGKFSQEQVDKIFQAAAIAADQARIPLAEMAVEETGMGLVEDKVIKNHYASEYIYNAYRHVKTCGVIEEDKAFANRCYCSSYTNNKSNINSDFQNINRIKNKKWNYN